MRVYLDNLASHIEFFYLQEKYRGMKFSDLASNHPFRLYLAKKYSMSSSRLEEQLEKTMDFKLSSKISESDILIGLHPSIYDKIMIINLPDFDERSRDICLELNFVISRFPVDSKKDYFIEAYDTSKKIKVTVSKVANAKPVTPSSIGNMVSRFDKEGNLFLELSSYFYYTSKAGNINLIGYLECIV